MGIRAAAESTHGGCLRAELVVSLDAASLRRSLLRAAAYFGGLSAGLAV